MSSHVYRGLTVWSGAQHGGTVAYEAYSRAYTFEMDGKPVLSGSADPVFRGDRRYHSPEDLLVAALSACHLLSYLALCARAGIVVMGYRDAAEGTMAPVAGTMRFREVTLRPHVLITAGDRAAALALHDRARSECFIANSVNFPVHHHATVDVA